MNAKNSKEKFSTKLRVGDKVIVISGGNAEKGRELKGKTGKILKVLPKKGRVLVEGLNMIKRHQRATSSQDASGIIDKEGSISISNVMYYNEDLARGVRVKFSTLEDGRKVRGFVNPETKKFEQIDL